MSPIADGDLEITADRPADDEGLEGQYVQPSWVSGLNLDGPAPAHDAGDPDVDLDAEYVDMWMDGPGSFHPGGKVAPSSITMSSSPVVGVGLGIFSCCAALSRHRDTHRNNDSIPGARGCPSLLSSPAASNNER